MDGAGRAAGDRSPRENEESRGRGRLFTLWVICLLAGLSCAWLFVAGRLRDSHFEEAELALSLARDGAWLGVDFRVWGGGPYVLWLTTLRLDPPFVEGDSLPETAEAPRFTGRIAVRILYPDGVPRLERVYDGASLDHVAGPGITWTRLQELRLDGLPFPAWRLEARVVEGDPAFEGGPGLRSRLILRKDRPEVGMGGLINYVMVIPAALFLVLSLGLAWGLARRGGSRAPAWISGLVLAALLGLLVL